MHRALRFLKKNRYISLAVIGFSLLSWSWVLFTKVTAMSSSETLGYTIAAIAVLINTAVSSAVLLTAVWYLQKTKPKRFLGLLKIGVVWAFAEFMAAWLTSIIWWGKDANVDTIEPFVSFAHLGINTPLLFAARFVGFFGLSALLVMLGVSIFSKTYRRYFVPILLVSCVLSLLGWYLYRTPSGPQITTVVAAEKLSEPKKITTSANLVVLPEYGLDDVTSENLDSRVQNNNNGETFFVGSTQKADGAQIHNILTFGSTKQGITKQQLKSRLVPGGEYLPIGAEIVLRIVQADSALTNFEVTRAVSKGSEPIHPQKLTNDLVVGAAVCSSIISTEDYRNLTNEGATLLTNSASLEIFNGSPIFTWQHTNLSRFMATANARPLIQSSNNGKTFVINQNGVVEASRWPVGTLEQTVTLNSQKTLYTIMGEWVVMVGAGFVVFDLLQHFLKKKRE